MKQQDEINRQAHEINNLKRYIEVLEKDIEKNKDDRKAYEHEIKRKVYLYQKQEIEALKRKLESDFNKAKYKYITFLYISVFYGIILTILFVLKIII